MATILLTGLSDRAAALLKYSASAQGLTPAQYVERLLDLDENLAHAAGQRFGVSADTGSLAGNVPARASSSGSAGSGSSGADSAPS